MAEFFTLKYMNIKMMAFAHGDIITNGFEEQMIQISSFPSNSGKTLTISGFSMSDDGEFVALSSTKRVKLPKDYSRGFRDYIDLSEIHKYFGANYAVLTDNDGRRWAYLLLIKRPQLVISYDILHHYNDNPTPQDIINLDEKQKNKTSEAINEILRWILDWAFNVAGRNPLEIINPKPYLAIHDFKMNQYAETYVIQKNKKLAKRYDVIMKEKEKMLEEGYTHKQKLLNENFKIKESELENAYKGALLLPKNMNEIRENEIISLIRTKDDGCLKVNFLTKFQYKPTQVSFTQRDNVLHELSEFELSLPKRDYYVGLEYNPNLSFCSFRMFKTNDINDTRIKHPHVINGSICMGSEVDKATKIAENIFTDRKMDIKKYYQVIDIIKEVLKVINLGNEYGHDFTYDDERDVIQKLVKLDVKQKETKKESVFIDKSNDSEEDTEDEEEPADRVDESELEPEH